jgi:NADPH:quinone reductase-like Zn-dependent oxidoreductase
MADSSDVTPMSPPVQMMALRAHRRGGPEQLEYELAPTPQPTDGAVLVEVHAAAITFAELGWDETWKTADGRDRTPTIPSHEMSGIVVEVAPDVAEVIVGDQVFGLVPFDRNGAAAEYVVLPASAVGARPRTVTHTEAAAVPLAGLTAWQALVDHAHLERGERVLVRGAAGGVGLFAVQLGAYLGGHVVAIAGAADAELVRDLGAETVVDYQDRAAVERLRVDIVIDAVGGAFPDDLYRVFRRGGRLVTLSQPPNEAEADRLGVQATFFIVTANREQLAHLARLVDTGQLRPIVAQTFPLSAGREAFLTGGGHRPPGKTVLEVRDATGGLVGGSGH